MRQKAISAKKWTLLLTSLISGLLLISTWAVASPPGGSPDEPTHLISIYCANDKYSAICANPYLTDLTLSAVSKVSTCYLFQRDRSANCENSNLLTKLEITSASTFYKYPDKPTYSHLDNFYYKILSNFASDSYIVSLLGMRFFNGLIFLTIFLLSILIVPRTHKNFFFISTLITAIPLGLYLATSINTSAWIITGSIGLWASAYALLFPNLSKDFKHLFIKFAMLLFSIFLMFSARFDGIYFILIILFSILIVFFINPLISFLQKYLNNYLIMLSLPLILVILSILLFYSFRDRAAVAFTDDSFNYFDRLFENFSKLPHLLLGPMGTWGLGWLDVWLTPITYASMIFLFLGTLFITMRYLDFPHFLSLIFIAISAVALPLLVLMSSGYRVGEWVQPRYILPLYFPLLGLALFASIGRLVIHRYQLFFMGALISIAHSAALFTNMERYIRGQNTYSYNLNVGLEWWWDQLPSPNLIWILGSLSFLILFMSLNELTKQEALKTR